MPSASKRSTLASSAMASLGFFGLALLGAAAAQTPAAKPIAASAATTADRKQMLLQYCSGCHSDKLKTAGMSVEQLDAAHLGANDAAWEAILRRLSLGEMPPKGMKRPTDGQIAEFTHWLSTALDTMAASNPDPGRATVRRMNRVEYSNAVRDLLGLDVDMSRQLPVDDSGYGFDNIADVLTVSPTLMDRYISVAEKVSSLAVGLASHTPVSTDYKLTKDLFENAFGVPAYNERASDDLPVDSRGGGSFKFYAPYDATYTIQLYLNPGTQTETEITPDNRYEVKVPLKAGLRTIGASFPKTLALEQVLIPRNTKGPRYALPSTVEQIALDVQVDGVRVQQLSIPTVAKGPNVAQAFYMRDVMQISVLGPYDIKGPGDTESRRRIFICRPSASLPEAACARRVLSTLARRAYRRPVMAADLTPLMKLYDEGRSGADFDHGIEAAIERVLVSPDFLFMREGDPKGGAPGSVHRISDTELATRLSFFLWSSIPDETLLSVAERGQLHQLSVLRSQVARMLADPKAGALTQNFAGQWLYLRRLEYQKPNRDEFPDFDQRLRTAMLTETQMFFDGVVRQNRSVLDFLNASYTYVNQRLAEHYGIPGVYGTSFRKVQLDPALHRSGLLGQGSILTVTSYDDRTSVVLRGKWILENLLAAPPPPPPPNVPSLDEVKNGKQLTVREKMELHRSNPVCASCHVKMDPLGFSLENYDAVGAWRTGYAGQKVDASAVLPDGTQFQGPQGLQGILLAHKDQFVEAFTEKLLTYALGRGLEGNDMPAVRKIRRAASNDNNRMDTIIMGIVQSVPFTMRRTPRA